MEPESQPLTTIFAKRPVPGQVKTRLCPPLDPAQAAALALAMLDDTVERELGGGVVDVELAVAPAESVDWFQERYGQRLAVCAQVGAGLGERMAAWFEARCGARSSVVIVGSDCPMLERSTVDEAHRLLASGTDAVFAPDGGGGYSLVGLARAVPELFTEVPMSTRSMLDETLDLARSRGLAVELLAEHRDVDDGDDLLRLDRELRRLTMVADRRAGADFPARTFDWLRTELGHDDEL
ncbi:MAG: rSAM/selenodomain-associated transferase 1 [Planctomycetota bacterium]|jgi:rSAM/selenodomain-associated transferase 1